MAKCSLDDSDAVRLVLEEKEKDLELAAKIGQSLLERNRDLQCRNEHLEEQMNSANEQLTQLRHELQWKIDLLHIYTDTSEVDSNAATPGDASEDVESLQKKLKAIEDENCMLKLEAGNLKSLNYDFEEKEQNLVTDCLKQLNNANRQVSALTEEVAAKGVECHKNQSEITALLQQLVHEQTSNKKMLLENEDLIIQLEAAQETQNELSQELMDLQERYAEVLAMLHEAREELKLCRQKQADMSSAYDSVYDSLASELEASDSSMGPGPSSQGQWPSGPRPSACKPLPRTHRGGLSVSGSAGQSARQLDSALEQSGSHIQRVMNAVRQSDACYSQSKCERSVQTSLSAFDQYSLLQEPYFQDSANASTGSVAPKHGSLLAKTLRCKTGAVILGEESESASFDDCNRAISANEGLLNSSSENCGKGTAGRHRGMDSYEFTGLRRVPSSESIYSFYDTPEPGVPGIPGSRDLEIAIRRLNLRRHVNQAYKAQRLKRLAELGGGETSSAKTMAESTRLLREGPMAPGGDPAAGFSDLSPIASKKRPVAVDSGLGSARAKANASSPVSSTPRSFSARLEIIKSSKGSPLLEKWRVLATPSITRSLVPIPGIRVRSQRQSPPKRSFLVEPAVSLTVQLQPGRLDKGTSCFMNRIPVDDSRSNDPFVNIASSSLPDDFGCSASLTDGSSWSVARNLGLATLPTYSSSVVNVAKRSYGNDSHAVEGLAHELDEMEVGARSGWPSPGSPEEAEGTGTPNSRSSFTERRQNPTSTYSMALGLAKLLKERAVDLVSANPWVTPTRQSCMTVNETGAGEEQPVCEGLLGVSDEFFNGNHGKECMDVGSKCLNDGLSSPIELLNNLTAIKEHGSYGDAPIPIEITPISSSSNTTTTAITTAFAYSTCTVTCSAQQGALIKSSSCAISCPGGIAATAKSPTDLSRASICKSNLTPGLTSLQSADTSRLNSAFAQPVVQQSVIDNAQAEKIAKFSSFESNDKTLFTEQTLDTNIAVNLSQRSSLISLLGPSDDNGKSTIDCSPEGNGYKSQVRSYAELFDRASRMRSEAAANADYPPSPYRPRSSFSSSKQSHRSSDLAIYASASSLTAATPRKDSISSSYLPGDSESSVVVSNSTVRASELTGKGNTRGVEVKGEMSHLTPVSVANRRRESGLPIPKKGSLANKHVTKCSESEIVVTPKPRSYHKESKERLLKRPSNLTPDSQPSAEFGLQELVDQSLLNSSSFHPSCHHDITSSSRNVSNRSSGLGEYQERSCRSSVSRGASSLLDRLPSVPGVITRANLGGLVIPKTVSVPPSPVKKKAQIISKAEFESHEKLRINVDDKDEGTEL